MAAPRTLAGAVRAARAAGRVAVVAEVKHAIPARPGARPGGGRGAAELARLYERGGAAAVSVVTARAHFGGAPEADLPAVLAAAGLPVLVKDFVTDPAQVDEIARVVGGWSAAGPGRCSVLLIAHHLGGPALARLAGHVRARGMEPLVEVRGEGGLDLAAGVPGLGAVAFNNKDVDALEVGPDGVRLDPGLVQAARARLPGVVVVSASGHRSPADAARSAAAGADAVLVGTALLTAADPGGRLAAFVAAGRRPG